MMNSKCILAIVAFLLVGISACQEKIEESKTATTTHNGIGVVTEIDNEAATITISHQEIPGFMAAMTMRFPVKEKNLLKEIVLEDSIRFTITKTDTDFFVSQIEKME
ncbi:MAG: copper-binding protein [Bacteroidota bacterium]